MVGAVGEFSCCVSYSAAVGAQNCICRSSCYASITGACNCINECSPFAVIVGTRAGVGCTGCCVKNAILIGDSTCTNHSYSTALGKCSCAKRPYEIWQRTNGDVASPTGGISGQGFIGLKRDNLAGTAGYLPLYVSEELSREFEFPASKNSVLTFSAEVSGRTTAADFVVGFTISGIVRIYNSGANIALEDIPEITQFGGDADVDAVVDVGSSPLRLRIMVKDKVGRTMHWAASMRYAEITQA